MKRFDFAGEVAKQQISLSSAIITIVITFYEKFFEKKDVVLSFWIMTSMSFLVISIIMGIFSIGGLTMLIERQESKDARKNDKGIISAKQPIVSLRGTGAEIFAKRQQLMFGFGFILFVLIAFLDRTGSFIPLKKSIGKPLVAIHKSIRHLNM